MDMNAIASNLNAAGFVVQSSQLKLDKWTSVKLIDNKQNKSGGYIINTQANVCSFINRKTLEKGSFPLDRAKVVSRAEYEKSIRENQKAERDKYFINAQGAAKKYNSLISPDGATSAYLNRKKVQNFGCKIDQKGNLVIPLRSMDIKADGTKVSYIRTLQTIYPDGTKIMETGCEKKGNMFLIGFNKIFREPEKYTGKILVAEGYATAASLHMATGLPTVVAIDAGNLDPAMSKITKFYNKAEYVICADNDLQTEQRTGRNPGVDAAKACQVKYNCAVVAPDFSKVIGGGNLTDFNDLHNFMGLEAVSTNVIDNLTPHLLEALHRNNGNLCYPLDTPKNSSNFEIFMNKFKENEQTNKKKFQKIDLSTNSKVLEYFEPIAPDLVSKVYADGKIEVSGAKGGTCYLQDEIPEYLAELLSIATGHEIKNNETIKDEKENNLSPSHEQMLTR